MEGLDTQRKRLTFDEIAELQQIAVERHYGHLSSARWQHLCKREDELLTKQRSEHVIGPVRLCSQAHMTVERTT